MSGVAVLLKGEVERDPLSRGEGLRKVERVERAESRGVEQGFGGDGDEESVWLEEYVSFLSQEERKRLYWEVRSSYKASSGWRTAQCQVDLKETWRTKAYLRSPQVVRFQQRAPLLPSWLATQAGRPTSRRS